MQTEFTPMLSLFGGMIIGLAAVILMATNGQIAGISGMLSRFIPLASDRISILTGIAFIAGLLLAAPILLFVNGNTPETNMVASPPVLIIAGLIVGFGARLGNGCTSGHGVCGLSRFSVRSLAATITFMLTAAITVYIIRHVIA